MQEGVGWDPASISYPIAWYVKLYLWYLVLVLFASLVRSIRLGTSLKSVRRRQATGLERPGDSDGVDSIAKASLGGILSCAAEQSEIRRAGFDWDRADARFAFVWQLAADKVRNMRRVVTLSFLLAFLVTTLQAIHFLDSLSTQRVAGAWTWRWWAEILTPFATGLFVCSVIYAIAIILENVLARRKLRWRHFYEESRISALNAAQTRMSNSAPEN